MWAREDPASSPRTAYAHAPHALTHPRSTGWAWCAAKKVPTSNIGELDRFLSMHTPVTLRLRAHLFTTALTAGGGAGPSKEGGEANLIEELQSPSQEDEARWLSQV